jgi:hypothetical protein
MNRAQDAMDTAQNEYFEAGNALYYAEDRQLKSQNNKRGRTSWQEGESTPEQWHTQKTENDGASNDAGTARRAKWSPLPLRRGNEKI